MTTKQFFYGSIPVMWIITCIHVYTISFKLLVSWFCVSVLAVAWSYFNKRVLVVAFYYYMLMYLFMTLAWILDVSGLLLVVVFISNLAWLGFMGYQSGFHIMPKWRENGN